MAMNRRTALGTALGLPGVAPMLRGGDPKGGYSVSAYVFRQGDSVVAEASNGRVISRLSSKNSAASVIQAAIDFVQPGGEVKIATGHYRLGKSIILYNSSTLVGEGRQTVITPPADDYALKIVKNSKSQILRRQIIPKAEGPTLIGVRVRNLALDGEGAGKGIYMEQIAGAILQGLWIERTASGSGLYIGPWVMESIFEDILMEANGNAEKKEPAVVIASGRDGANNLHFENLFVIYPNYIGLKIGYRSGPNHPRCIFISHSMFHGWLPPFSSHYDLIRVACDRRPDSELGLVLRDSRLTHAGRGAVLLRVEQGDVKVIGNHIGGGLYKYGIWGDAGATLTITENTIQQCEWCEKWNPHYIPTQPFAVFLRGAQATISDNVFGAGVGPVRFSPGFNCIVTGNRFLTTTAKPRVLIGDDGQHGSRNIVVSGNFFAANDAGRAIAVSRLSTSGTYIRDNCWGSRSM